MPRNRYTRLVRKSERIQFDRQEKKLAALVRALRRGITEPTELAFVMSAKERRSTRLEHKRRHKPTRTEGVVPTSQQHGQAEPDRSSTAGPVGLSETSEVNVA